MQIPQKAYDNLREISRLIDETAYLAQYDIDGLAWASQNFMKWKDGR